MLRSNLWMGRRAVLYAISTRRFHRQTVQTVLTNVRARLDAVGITGSDAKALVANALEPKLTSSHELFLHLHRQLQADEAQRLERTAQRRIEGEPLAYVLGVKEFWSLELHVTRDTLIPRADSECLIEALVDLYPKRASLRVLDLGTGSGALLLATLSEFPHATGVGLDISHDALAVAMENAQQLGFGDRASFLEYDMEQLPGLTMNSNAESYAASLGPQLLGQFHVILCNPPYIPLTEVPLIAPDVLAYEPHGALFSAGPHAWTSKTGDPNDHDDDDDLGLRFYIALRNSIDKLLYPKSSIPRTVVVEIGSERQAHAVRDLFVNVSSVSFEHFLLDASGHHRGLVFRSHCQQS